MLQTEKSYLFTGWGLSFFCTYHAVYLGALP